MKPILIFLLLLVNIAESNGQSSSEQVKLLSWSFAACDNTYDPYLLKTRVSDTVVTDSSLLLTVHFSANCCSVFEPSVRFRKDTLALLPYTTYLGEYCTCNCCFSIQYEIAGLPNTHYNITFAGKPIQRSDNYYDTVSVTYEIYEGAIINLKNKYGFKEGLWITFYKNGKRNVENMFATNSLHKKADPIWIKYYSPSGKLKSYWSSDTTENYFEDGTLQSQKITYEIGDTSFSKGSYRYTNRKLQREYFEKTFPTIFTSEFDSSFQQRGSKTETIYESIYFESGKPQYQYQSDTSYTWHANGSIKIKQYKDGKLVYDTKGRLVERHIYWLEKGPKTWRNLEHQLLVTYFENQNIESIIFLRTEYNNEDISPDVRYQWTWNKRMQCTSMPENWNEPLPWISFPEIQLHQMMREGSK